MADKPYSTALEFISKWDYHNATAAQEEKLKDQVNDFPRQAEWDEEDLRAAFKHLHQAVCTPDFPVYDTGPASLAKAALDFLLRETGKNEVYYGEYTAFILGCIASGPNLAQIDMMSNVILRGGMKTCFQAMSGQQLCDFLRGLKKQFVNNETLPKDYAGKLSTVLRTRIIQDFTKDQAAEYRMWFVELLMYYQSLTPKSDEHMAVLYYTSLCSAIESLLGREKWKDLETKLPDPTCLLFREQIKSICDVVKAGKFPAHEKQADIFKNCLRNIFEIVRLNKTYFPMYLDDVMKCLPVFAKLPYSDVQQKLLDPHSTFFSKLRDNKELIKNKPDLFERYAPLVTNLILDMPHSRCLGGSIKDILQYLLAESAGGLTSTTHLKIWSKLMAALVSQPDTRYVEACERFMRDNKKIFRWKEYVEGARLILTTIAGVKFYPKEEDKGRMNELDPDRVGRKMANATEELLKQLKNSKLLGEFQADILSMVQQFLEGGDQNTFSIAKECCEFVELKDDLSLALPAIQTYDKLFKKADYPWTHWALVGVTMDLLIHVIKGHKDPQQFKPYVPYYVSIFKTAMSRDYWDYESGSKNIFGYVLIGPLICFGALYATAKDHSDLQPLLGDTVRMLTCDDDDIANGMSSLFTLVSTANPGLFAPYLKDILAAMFKTENTSLIRVVQGAYTSNPSPVDEEFQRVFGLLDTMSANSKSSIIMLLKEIANHKPQLFTTENIVTLFDSYMDNPMTCPMVIQLLQSISQKAPGKLEPHMDKLYENMSSLMGAAMIPTILVNIASKNKKQTKPVFDKLVHFVKTCTGDYTHLSVPLNAIRILGSEDREILKPHKDLFEKTGEKHTNLKDMCKMLIDIIEGRSAEDITDKIEQQQEDIGQLDVRVANNENEVTVIGQEVGKQGQTIGQIRQDVDKQEVRVDGLEEKVEDTVIKVEEIDNKTLSNAPAWSRDVSKLLNPEAEHDWRLLAQRLSYSPEDIRGWATQHDPCMSLLSEWFATHKTSEATKAVLKTLEEMNRLDAAEIVGRAMKAVENVVQDEPPDYENPPPVFISYQWGHQQEARVLRKHLEMAGFESWIDIGQMGGGDKLYAKIDEGIRAAKVVICCVTEKYAKSPNCNREVNLAVNLGKPIIPLLLENVAWPPPGAMGPIFGEYLYIRFFQRGPQEDPQDERVWPPFSFQELLMQLSYMKLIPEQSKIKKPYTNWWLPPEEVIVVKKKSSNGKEVKTIAKSDEKQEEGSQPDVFISYQWGHQADVKALYKRMCGLGYHCWMDIHQMGGGDSLYDKIDRGVRGCKVVISCVTEKYSKSANCRREVSLADALKKPIIPLLFEGSTWPPSGPMSMVFTQLLYIDFKDDKIRSSWSGPKFDELLDKIKAYTPDDSGRASGDTKKKESIKTAQSTNGHKTTASANNGNKDKEQVKKAKPIPVQHKESIKTAQSTDGHKTTASANNGNKDKEQVKKAQPVPVQDNHDEPKKASDPLPVASAPPPSAPQRSESPTRPKSNQNRRTSRPFTPRPFTPKKESRSKSCLIL